MWLDDRTITPELAAHIEGLGYGAVWIGGSPESDLAWAEPALTATTTLVVASGVVTVLDRATVGPCADLPPRRTQADVPPALTELAAALDLGPVAT